LPASLSFISTSSFCSGDTRANTWHSGTTLPASPDASM
jgi:hypothetical protein